MCSQDFSGDHFTWKYANALSVVDVTLIAALTRRRTRAASAIRRGTRLRSKTDGTASFSAQIGVVADSGLARSAICTAANVHDVT